LKTKIMCSLFPWQHGISYLFIDSFVDNIDYDYIDYENCFRK
jgi:hypothetical protein